MYAKKNFEETTAKGTTKPSCLTREQKYNKNDIHFYSSSWKTITSHDYKVILLLLEMSKAFDPVRRYELFNIIKEVLDQDEL